MNFRKSSEFELRYACGDIISDFCHFIKCKNNESKGSNDNPCIASLREKQINKQYCMCSHAM